MPQSQTSQFAELVREASTPVGQALNEYYQLGKLHVHNTLGLFRRMIEDKVHRWKDALATTYEDALSALSGLVDLDVDPPPAGGYYNYYGPAPMPPGLEYDYSHWYY